MKKEVKDKIRGEAGIKSLQYHKRYILDHISDIAWLKDKKGRYIAINKAFEDKCGSKASELLGKTDFAIWPKNFAKKYRSDDMEVMLTGKRRIFEETLVDRNGIRHTIETTKSPFHDRGVIIGTVGIAHDITRRKQAEDELDNLNMLLNSIIEYIPDMIFLKEPKELKFVRLNCAGEELLGYDRSELIGKNDYDFFTKKEAEFFIKQDRKALLSKKILDIPEEPIHTRKKGIRILHTKKVAILNSKGEPGYLLGISEDITDRKKIETDLAYLKKQLEFVLGATKTGIDIIDSDYNLVYVDPAWTKIYGDYKGKKCYRYFMGKDKICPNCSAKKAFKLKKPVTSEERLERENNRPISVTSIPFKDDNGKWMVAEVNVDIAEIKKTHVEIERLKKAKQDIKELEKRYRTIFESASDAIFLADAETGIIVDANKRASQLIRRPVSEIIGMHQAALHPEEDAQIYKSTFSQCVDSKKNLTHSFFVVDKYRKRIPVQIATSTIHFKEKKYLMGIFSDISSLKKVEENLKQDRSSLEAVVARERENLDRALRNLEAAKRLADIGSLASMVAHELRNPLGVIKTALYNIKHKIGTPFIDNVKGHIDNIDKKISESNYIIGNLLSYSKVFTPNYEKFSIYEIIEECAADFRHRHVMSKVKFQVDCALARQICIDADRTQLLSLLSNLLDNAYQALPGGAGTLRLNCRYHKNRKSVVIDVKDSGIGMSDRDMARAFEPFFSLKAKGIGLGLSVCKQITELHRGTIELASQRSKGTTARVILPVNR